MSNSVGIGMIGAGLMGKAHSLALGALPMYVDALPVSFRREIIAEIDPAFAQASAERFGFERSTSNWRDLLSDPAIDIVDVVVPSHLHRAIVSEAVAAGKGIICEKPLGMSVAEARELRDLVKRAGVVNQIGFNWRYAPSVRLAKRLIDEGAIGEVLSFRGTWLADSGMAPGAEENWRYDAAVAGSGSIGDLGSHVIDWARLLVGEISEVVSTMRTYARGDGVRTVEVDDDVEFLITFENGAFGSIEATRFTHGRKNHCGFELYGKRGSLVFDWERMNELRFYDGSDKADRQGFRTILTGPNTPGAADFWPVAGFGIGYLESKLLQFKDLADALANNRAAETTFDDAAATAAVVAAVQASAASHQWQSVN